MFADNYLEDLPFDLSNFIYELKYQLELDDHKKHMGIVFNQFNSLYSHLAIPLFTQLRCSLMTCQCCRNMTNEMIDDDFLELWDPYLTHDMAVWKLILRCKKYRLSNLSWKLIL